MKKILLAFSGLFLMCLVQTSGSHLMGGQITARQLTGSDYEITLTLYRDVTGIPVAPSASMRITNISSGSYTLVTFSHTGMIPLFNGVEKYEYVGTYTFPVSGSYLIEWSDCCRNPAILNMVNPGGESMYFMTGVAVDTSGTNSTPVFLNEPITLAQKNSIFQYNPLPYDADGDSLHWMLDVPLSDTATQVFGYSLPHAGASYPFSLNSITGELTWMPDSNGHWASSFVIEEFRGGIKIGEIRRDMQIIVVDDTSNYQHMMVDNGSWPVDMAGNFSMDLTANVPFNLVVNATDLDLDSLTLSVQGESMIVSINPSQFAITNSVPGSVSGTYSWTPNSSQVRMEPYICTLRGYEYHNAYVFVNDQTIQFHVNAAIGINENNSDFKIGRVYPNPTSGDWSLSFYLNKPSLLTIDLFNMQGQKINSLLDQQMSAGSNLFVNRRLPLASGMYYVRINEDGKLRGVYPLMIK